VCIRKSSSPDALAQPGDVDQIGFGERGDAISFVTTKRKSGRSQGEIRFKEEFDDVEKGNSLSPEARAGGDALPVEGG